MKVKLNDQVKVKARNESDTYLEKVKSDCESGSESEGEIEKESETGCEWILKKNKTEIENDS